MSSDESERLIKMEETLHQRVIGQEEAVVAISRAIRRARVGLKNPNRPIASFIFSGERARLCALNPHVCRLLSENQQPQCLLTCPLKGAHDAIKKVPTPIYQGGSPGSVARRERA